VESTGSPSSLSSSPLACRLSAFPYAPTGPPILPKLLPVGAAPRALPADSLSLALPLLSWRFTSARPSGEHGTEWARVLAREPGAAEREDCDGECAALAKDSEERHEYSERE
jgi:hypothetical protein